jgi:methyl-accepting chemotaxis protein
MDISKLVRRVKTYFVVAVGLKIALAVSSLLFKDAFWLGFIFPLTVMCCYWLVGYRVRKKWDIQLSVAKFADSIYYLGFLFTVGSIIICLIDINAIGDNLNGMATRFGAAMVSTAIGMLARVLHTGFKVDANDAVKSVEERAIQSAEHLTMSFDAASQQLEVFRDQVMAASKEAVQSVHEQITAISQHSTAAMDAYFSNSTEQSNEAFERILADAGHASGQLLTTINDLSDKSENTLSRLEEHALDFGKKAQSRLEHTLFPDDLFSEKLKPALEALNGTTEGVSEGVSSLADDVKTAARQVGTAIKSLNAKTQVLEGAMTSSGSIVESQGRLADAINQQGQLVMERIENIQKEFLVSLEIQRKDYRDEMLASQQMTAKIVERLEELSLGNNKIAGAEQMNADFSGVLNSISEVGAKNNQAFAESIGSTLLPLVEAIEKNNETFKRIELRVLQSEHIGDAANIQISHLVEADDRAHNVGVNQPVVNDVGASTTVGSTPAEGLSANDAVDARTA